MGTRSLITQLSQDVQCLRAQVSTLTAAMTSFIDGQAQSLTNNCARVSPALQHPSPTYVSAISHRTREPVQPKFVGLTRSAFSFHVAESSMTRMGIAAVELPTTGPSSADSSRATTPEPLDKGELVSASTEIDPMLGITEDEAARLVGIYRDEIASVHPIIETNDLALKIPQILDSMRTARHLSACSKPISEKDVHMLRIAIATAVLCESHGGNEISDKLVASVKHNVAHISNDAELELKDIQIMGMLVSLVLRLVKSRIRADALQRVYTFATHLKSYLHGVL